MAEYAWTKITEIVSRSYECGYCNNSVANEKGWSAYEYMGNPNIQIGWVYVCHHCGKPTFFDKYANQFPGSAAGNHVNDIADPTVLAIYEEARFCTSVNAFTATVLCCRKLLMHIAVSKGAQPGESFQKYVEYLESQHYAPPGSKDWVDLIRQKGNEANHEIVIMAENDARTLLGFCEMLLKFIFEYPAAAKKP